MSLYGPEAARKREQDDGRWAMAVLERAFEERQVLG